MPRSYPDCTCYCDGNQLGTPTPLKSTAPSRSRTAPFGGAKSEILRALGGEELALDRVSGGCGSRQELGEHVEDRRHAFGTIGEEVDELAGHGDGVSVGRPEALERDGESAAKLVETAPEGARQLHRRVTFFIDTRQMSGRV